MKAKTLAGSVVVLILIAVAANSFGLAYWPSPGGRFAMWLVTTAMSIFAVMAIGLAISGYVSGLIIDNRNMMSLSKLQMLIWTLVILPALITGAAANLEGIGTGAVLIGLDIDIPKELLAALGLAGATLAASPIILSTKAGSAPHPDEITSTSAQLGLTGQVTNTGKVFGKKSLKDSSWLDLFRGDEVGNADTPDLGKIQQFFVTVLLAGIYLGAIAAAFKGVDAIHALPPLSERFIWLLGVSHGTYLAYKAAPHTNDAPPGTPLSGTQNAQVSQPPPNPAAPGIVTAVKVRLAIDEAASIQALTLIVDNVTIPVAADGQIEVPLEVGRLHTISASGMRGGQQVQGQVQITPTLNDEQKPLLLKLA